MTLREWLAERAPDILLADGFDAALIGYAERCGEPARAVYDVDRCIALLRDHDGLTEEDAVDFFEYNVLGAWVGPHTPMFLTRPPDDLEAE